MEYRDLKKRYVGLDIFRIASAFFVCMFHTTIHLGCDYGILQNVSRMGAVFMTAFFLLSGFSLFVNWCGADLTEFTITKRFWKKRFLSVVPMYLFAAILYEIMRLAMGKDIIANVGILFPIEALGIQSVFSNSLSGFSHNAGTWFISCILLCYLAYPLLQLIIIHTSKKTHIILLALCFFVLLYSPLVVYYTKYPGIYRNPFFRMVEFFVGMILAAMKKDFADSKIVNKVLYSWVSAIIVFIIMCCGITIAVNKNIEVGNFMLYNLICLPCFSITLFGLSGVESKPLEKSRLIKYLAKSAYVFFLAQLFSNEISKYVIKTLSIDNKVTIMALGWGMCIGITVLFSFIEKIIKSIIHNKL